VHFLLQQACPLLQLLPQIPQFAGVRRSVQLPAQQ
jgi:hypothetical protein